MGLGDFIAGAGKAAVNVAKGAAFVADPRNLDDIGEGIGKVGSFVAKNPGKTWDTGFEVGRAMLKDQLKPQNLAITAALVGATALTGGAAAPALAAKLGMGVKTADVGLSALKGADTAVDAFKAVKTGAKVLDTAADVGKTLKRTERFVQDVRGTATAFKEAKGLAKLDQGLGALNEVKGAGREAMGLSRYGKIAETRAGWAEAAADKGFGKAVSGKIAGASNSAADASKVYSSTARMRSRYNKVQGALSAPGEIGKGVEIAADPQAAVRERAMAEINARAGKSAYTPTTSMTSNSSGFAPLSQPMTAAASGQAQSPFGGGILQPLSIPKATSMPTVGRSKSAFSSGTASAMKQPMQQANSTMQTAIPETPQQSSGQQPIGSPALPVQIEDGTQPLSQKAFNPATVVGANAPAMQQGSRTARRGRPMYSAPGMGKSVADSMGGRLGI